VTSDLFSISGKTAVVTGGSRGIGLMITRGFVEAGVKVYISSRKAEVCDEVAAGLSRVDRRLYTAVTKTSLVRYDAYAGAGGHQSASIALLDAARSGVVLSAIQGRDYARIYVKELDQGRPSVALSPEEQEAVERAMAR